MVKELIKAKMDLQQFVVTEYKINQWCSRLFTEQKQSVSWCSSVWNHLSVPKHRIILWLAILDRLHTKDRLWKMHIVQTKNCLLCTDEEETRHHLFFDYRFSAECFSQIKEWLHWRSKKTKLLEVLRWIDKCKRISKFRRNVLRAAVAACIYQIWTARNEQLWIQKIGDIRSTVQIIKHRIVNRVRHVMPKEVSKSDREWFDAICTK